MPVTALNHLVGGHKVADEQEHAHDDVLSNRGYVGAGDFEDFDTLLDGSIEIDVVGTDTSGDAKLQVLGLREGAASGTRSCFGGKVAYSVKELTGEVSGVEGGGDDDVSLERQV